MRRRPITMAFCGDVMLGRGIDQILPHPGDPRLREPHVRDARHYVEMAERLNGPIARPVGYSWLWGDALEALTAYSPDIRVLNLETTVTRSDEFAPGKAVHYRMCPDNAPGLTAADPDACVLANNHMLDFGQQGLLETLDILAAAGLRSAGAGCDVTAAHRPAVVPLVAGGRVLVFSYGTPSSGVPLEWAADTERPGLAVIPEPSAAQATQIGAHVQSLARPEDLIVVSIHWGSNWGYAVSRRQVHFAHRLIDAGVDIVHGHSSHHPRPIELYRGKLIMYGCGDFIDDYEGIQGFEEFRDDLRLLYLASVEPETGLVIGLRMVPLQSRRLRLHRASIEDSAWLQATLTRIGRRFGTRCDLEPDGSIKLVKSGGSGRFPAAIA